MAVESLDIRVRQQGARTVTRDIRNIGFAANAVTGSFTPLQRALQGLAIAGVARRVAAFADEFQNLRNRVRLYNDSQETANKVTGELISIANRARVATDAVSLTYQRLAINQDRLGLSTERTTRLVELLSKSVAAGGSNAQEAGGALRQFSQALSSNFRAAAQELNSVLEQTPGLARALADGLGTTVDQIKVLAREGRLNSKLVVEAIESQADVIEARFARIAPTIGQAFQVLENATGVFIGQFFRASQFGQTLAKTVIDVATAMLRLANDEERLNNVVDATKNLLTALIAIRVTRFLFGVAGAFDVATASARRFIAVQVGSAFSSIATGAASAGRALSSLRFSSIASGLASVRASAFTAAGALGLLRGAASGLLTGLKSLIGVAVSAVRAILLFAGFNPLTALVAAAVALGAALFSLRNEVVTVGGESVKLRDLVVATFQVMRERVGALVERVAELGGSFLDNLGGVRGFVNASIAGLVSLGEVAAKVASSISDFFRKAFQNLGAVLKAALLAARGQFSEAQAALFEGVDISSSFQIDPSKILNENLKRDFLQEFADLFEGTDIGRRAAELARQRAREAAAAGGETDTGTPNAPPAGGVQQLTDVLSEQQEAVAGVIAQYDVGTRVALEFIEVQNDLAEAVQKGVISQKESRQILQELAADSFRRLAAETDDVASATIEFNDRIEELTARAAAGGIGADELTAAIARQRDEFQKALLDIEEYQAALSDSDALFKGVQSGFERFSDSLGNMFSNIADLTETVLDKGLSALDEFVMTGEFNIREFGANVIAEFQKVLNRLILIEIQNAFQSSLQGQGGFFENLFQLNGRTNRPQENPPATAATGRASEGVRGIFSGILGGGRNEPDSGGQVPTGSPADPLFVSIARASEGLVEQTDILKEATDQQTATQEEAQGGFVDTLVSFKDSLIQRITELPGQIGSFFVSVGDFFSGIFEGGLTGLGDKIVTGLGDLGTFLQDGFSGIFQGIFGGSEGGGLLGAIGGLFGGGGGGAGGGGGSGSGAATALKLASTVLGAFTGTGGFGGALADGGVLSPSQLGQAFLVGEEGPELFAPRQSGTVVPSDALAQMAAPPAPNVNVQVVNVDDPGSVANAMSSKEGERVILNMIQRNKSKIREITS